MAVQGIIGEPGRHPTRNARSLSQITTAGPNIQDFVFISGPFERFVAFCCIVFPAPASAVHFRWPRKLVHERTVTFFGVAVKHSHGSVWQCGRTLENNIEQPGVPCAKNWRHSYAQFRSRPSILYHLKAFATFCSRKWVIWLCMTFVALSAHILSHRFSRTSFNCPFLGPRKLVQERTI